MKTLLIYGATGYTGGMIAKQAKAAGLKVAIAGRNKKSRMSWQRRLTSALPSLSYKTALSSIKAWRG
ncbi:hypothetical protein GTU79_24880 [Sodalis ligni]|jgi:short subunit dehydrogenase-like uncharacterized protein|uniref:hypothetical protein n=1 Tax=Sodalis ligni TaxID=2697027 RepID=UPI00193F042E|nr:hypothetical protein [Sodalis ligni]QWA10405.1 hypothetical protein GTU79_24880 [Sodalis ligni]